MVVQGLYAQDCKIQMHPTIINVEMGCFFMLKFFSKVKVFFTDNPNLGRECVS